MGKEIYTEVEGTNGRKSTRFYMTLDEAAFVADSANRIVDKGGNPEGVEIDFGKGKKRHFDDLTVELGNPIEKPNKN